MLLFTDSSVVRDSGSPDAAASLSGEESQRSAAGSAIIERLAREGEGDAASPSADVVAPSEFQPAKV